MGENVTWVFTLVMVIAAAVVLYLLRRTRALSWTLALGVDLPISRAVLAVIEGRLSPREAVAALLAREPRAE